MIQMNPKNPCTTISVSMERCCSIVWVRVHFVCQILLKLSKLFRSLSVTTSIHLLFCANTNPFLEHHIHISVEQLKRHPFSFVMVFHLLHPFYSALALSLIRSLVLFVVPFRKTAFICISGADNYLFYVVSCCISVLERVCVFVSEYLTPIMRFFWFGYKMVKQ